MDSILFTELDAAAGKIGRITLNAPASLNTLTLDMVEQLQSHLERWAKSKEIAALFIDGAGGKAFCAGGNVRVLRTAEAAEAFFIREYRMNYSLHTYPKPIACWGGGIVMGGGLGIMAGCSHRIVTETTRIAMPEIAIALFPDVGASWFLNRMPGKAGDFLALTGAAINATDAIFAGIADSFIPNDRKQSVLDHLLKTAWTDNAQTNRALCTRAIHTAADRDAARDDIARDTARKNPHTNGSARNAAQDSADNHASDGAPAAPPPQLEPHLETINTLCDGDDIHHIIDNITALPDDAAPWLLQARNNLRYGSKLAALWIHRQLQLTRTATLREAFQSEAILATNIARHPEFHEGVRALLIDKDRAPSWTHQSSRQIPPSLLTQFFHPPWPQNPLSDLRPLSS